MVFIPSCTLELSVECLKCLSFTLEQLNQNFWGQGLTLLKSSWVFSVFICLELSSPANKLCDRDLHIGSLLASALSNNICKIVNKEGLSRRGWTLAVITEIPTTVNATGRSKAGVALHICLISRQSSLTSLYSYIHPTLDFSYLLGMSVTLGIEALSTKWNFQEALSFNPSAANTTHVVIPETIALPRRVKHWN